MNPTDAVEIHMKTSNRHRRARTILFERVELPGTAFAIDHLGAEPEMSEEASVWLWRFTICVGVTNRDSAANVIRFAGEALDVATRHRERLLRELPARFDGPFDEAFDRPGRVVDGAARPPQLDHAVAYRLDLQRRQLRRGQARVQLCQW